MKKLMIAAAIVCAAAISQAATVSWTITSVKQGTTSLTKGHTYIFFADSADAASTQIAAIKGLAQKGATAVTAGLSGNKWNDIKRATAAGNFSISTASGGGSYTLPTNKDLGLTDGTTYYAYAVIFDTETITDKSNYLIVSGSPASSGVTTKSGQQNLGVNWGPQGGNTDWYAVGEPEPTPEPTSAMLMLLGVAGLALRRKRA